MVIGEKEASEIIDPILAAFRARLYATLLSHTSLIYVRGSAEMTRFAGLPFEGPPSMQAIKWAERHCAKLVKEIDTETKTRLAKVISDGIKNKSGIPELTRKIKTDFADMTKARAELISRTETNNALSSGSFDRMKDIGFNGKQWVTVGDDKVRPEHVANEAVGIIPMDDPFPDSSMHPPGTNPFNCRCTLAPAMLPEKEA